MPSQVVGVGVEVATHEEVEVVLMIVLVGAMIVVGTTVIAVDMTGIAGMIEIEEDVGGMIKRNVPTTDLVRMKKEINMSDDEHICTRQVCVCVCV